MPGRAATLSLALLLVAAHFDSVGSLPSGAAGCTKGSPAVQGFHLDKGPTSASKREGGDGPLDLYGTSLMLNNVTINASDTTLSFRTGTNIAWSIVHAGNISMRGVLFRVEATSDVFTVSGDGTAVQEARACDSERGNVIGITHRDRSDKPAVTGVMRFDAPTTVSIDVSVVYRNGRVAPGNSSYYSYNAFRVAITGPPTPTAARPPAPAPVAAPPVACDANGCTSVYGFKGQIMKRQIGGLCVARCTRKSLVGVRRITGWRCGTCGFGPDANR